MAAERGAATSPHPPLREREVGRMLRHAEERIRVIHACTPNNLEAELAAVRAAWQRSAPRTPRWSYPKNDAGRFVAPLEELARALERRGRRSQMLASRALELALEARLCAAVGRSELRELAAQRYGDGHEADALAERWRKLCPAEERREHLSDDARDPGSLLNMMRAEVGRERVGVAVVVAPLAALAATGRGVIFVARGRRMSAHAVRRTVLHEVHGHALPRWRAASAQDVVLDVGTGGASDDQEGYALALEEQAGWLDDARKRELGLRHLAARSVRTGASFTETLAALVDWGADPDEAARIAARVHRGGGLAREVAYLPAFLRVRPLLGTPAEDVLSRGRVALRFAAGWRGDAT